MYVAIGHFKLKKLRRLFQFLKLSNGIKDQALSAKGNLGVELSGGSLTKFYVISKWDSAESMKEFTYSGVHMDAIKLSKELAGEIRLLYFQTDESPDMKTAKKLLMSDERVRVI